MEIKKEELLGFLKKTLIEDYNIATNNLSNDEKKLLENIAPYPLEVELKKEIKKGNDPLGELYKSITSKRNRQKKGQFFTEKIISTEMIKWTLNRSPDYIIDPGTGTGRFLTETAKQNSDVNIIGIEKDPLISLIARANSKVVDGNIEVWNQDFLEVEEKIAKIQGKKAFIGNPPYVRHHDLGEKEKNWSKEVESKIGVKTSSLAGLHAYFFWATAHYGEKGDIGCYITSSEWLDNGYGDSVRKLLLEKLGLNSLHLLDPKESAFADAMTTSLITCFEVLKEDQDQIKTNVVRKPEEFDDLEKTNQTQEKVNFQHNRWSEVIRNEGIQKKDSMIPLKEVARVHRGIVTGANDYFILTSEEAKDKNLTNFTTPCLRNAEEIFDAGLEISKENVEHRILNVPRDLDRNEMPTSLVKYIEEGEKREINQGYICSNRDPWWSIGNIKRPPIVMTYMGRRPPAFSLNPDGIAIINIAHGIHPKEDLSRDELIDLVKYLREKSEGFQGRGRTYQGGLEKFEPSEAENLLIPEDLISKKQTELKL